MEAALSFTSHSPSGLGWAGLALPSPGQKERISPISTLNSLSNRQMRLPRPPARCVFTQVAGYSLLVYDVFDSPSSMTSEAVSPPLFVHFLIWWFFFFLSISRSSLYSVAKNHCYMRCKYLLTTCGSSFNFMLWSLLMSRGFTCNAGFSFMISTFCNLKYPSLQIPP